MGHIFCNWFKSIERNNFDMEFVKLQNSGNMYDGTKTKIKREFGQEPVNWLR